MDANDIVVPVLSLYHHRHVLLVERVLTLVRDCFTFYYSVPVNSCLIYCSCRKAVTVEVVILMAMQAG